MNRTRGLGARKTNNRALQITACFRRKGDQLDRHLQRMAVVLNREPRAVGCVLHGTGKGTTPVPTTRAPPARPTPTPVQIMGASKSAPSAANS